VFGIERLCESVGTQVPVKSRRKGRAHLSMLV
jgi:hypothetical protein